MFQVSNLEVFPPKRDVLSSSETQGQIVGGGGGPNDRRRKSRDGCSLGRVGALVAHSVYFHRSLEI